MRVERLPLWILALGLAGCVTTQSSTGSLGGKPLPQTSEEQQAQEAARIHTQLGQRYMANGDLQTALEKLDKALKFDPNYAPAHTVIAVLYERIDRPADAEAHYRKAVELEPTKGSPNNNLGQFLCAKGQYAEADTYFRKAVADPFYDTPDVALTNAGLCQLRAGKLDVAEADFRDAIVKNPNNAQALLLMASTLFGQGDAFRARAFLQRFDAQGQPTAASLKLGHDIETRLGNPDLARAYNTQLQSKFPDSDQARALDTAAKP